MAEADRKLSNGASFVDFQTDPTRYRHWRIAADGSVATLTLDVDENGGLFEGYQLKLNSYDLGVDIELYDAIQRLRFEHPEVKAVILRSGKPRVFCAGANIRMLAGSSHAHKVNFCKFTNETRNAIEDASAHSGQKYICVVNGTAAGGGYELALAADHILLVDDGSSAVALPELPLLAVLPGTGGLTRVTDKRKVRRDRADFFCTTEEGVEGKRAVEWRLVDEIAPQSKLEARAQDLASSFAEQSKRSGGPERRRADAAEAQLPCDGVDYGHVSVELNRAARIATVTVKAPEAAAPASAEAMAAQGASFWPLQIARELDDAILHLRFNETRIAAIVFKSIGDPARVLTYDAFLEMHASHWLANEIRHFWKRVLKRHRRDFAHPRGAHRAGLVLRRNAGGIGTSGRPLLHVDRPDGRRQSRAADDRAEPSEFRRLSHVPWVDASRGAARRRRPRTSSTPRRASAKRSMEGRRRSSASSPSRSTTSIGPTRCACS